jgi:hypothetical protein
LGNKKERRMESNEYFDPPLRVGSLKILCFPAGSLCAGRQAADLIQSAGMSSRSLCP